MKDRLPFGMGRDLRDAKGNALNRARILSFREEEGQTQEDARSDEEIMLSVTSDVSELGHLFERHHKALFLFFFRVTGNRGASEDLVQDVFFRILKYRHTFRPGMPFARWMYRIAINARRDRARKHGADERLEPSIPDMPGPGPLPEELLSRRQELARLRRALSRLPEDKRELLVLSRFRNLKYAEIAEILGVREAAVKVRVFRALQELRNVFLENGPSGEEA
jgi:RNA polymerase sigma factor (sigma-70 family)